MSLSDTQIDRYARHLVLREVGGPGQQKLLSSRVLIIGAGGLGSPLALYLAAAGVGTLGIVDDDVVSLSNLQRQILHKTDAVGQPKTASAEAALQQINPDVTVEAYPTRLTAENALDLIGRYDLVADGSDSFATRLLVNDASYLAGKTWSQRRSAGSMGNWQPIRHISSRMGSADIPVIVALSRRSRKAAIRIHVPRSAF